MRQLTDVEFLFALKELGPTGVSQKCGINVRNIHARRKRLEHKMGSAIKVHDARKPREHPARHLLRIKHGVVIVGSDPHYWPGEPSPAHRALLKFIRKMKPAAVVMNGDVFDGSSISRYPPIGWETQPLVHDELEACKLRMGEVEKAAKGAKLIWPLGNHDARFETRLATIAPQYRGVTGVHLRDHFPKWMPCWSCFINDDVVVKHRWKGGDHAAYNNTVKSGRTIITGHLHTGQVTAFTDYNGTRWGVDLGTLADPNGKQFVDYTEDNPLNWRSGFGVLTFRNGRLMWPEFVHVTGPDTVQFRGEEIKV
jgi:hypothetical protein